MTSRSIIAVGWIVAFAGLSAYGNLTVLDLEEKRQIQRAIAFRDYVESQHFSLRLASDDRGRVTVRKRFLGPRSQAEVVCGGIPADTGFDFLPQARYDLYFVEQCLSQEMPGLNIDTTYDEVLREVQERLDSLNLPSQYDVTQADLIRLEPWAQSYLSRLLKKEGLPRAPEPVRLHLEVYRSGATHPIPVSSNAVRLPGRNDGGQDDDVPMILCLEISPPKVKHRVEPKYPQIAQRARIQGTVVLEVVIDRDGTVRDARVVRSAPLLDDAAISALKEWKYEPARDRQGHSVPVYSRVSVKFEIPSPETSPAKEPLTRGSLGALAPGQR